MMRNSIQGPLLRSGHNSSFKALGETGYPVFKMAFQLREAIYRLDAGRDLARHLAIPQNDQGGDRTDWYSSFPGDVIPWSGANDTERASARQQFSEFQTAVQALSEQLLNANQNGAGGDRRVFAQLLKSVVHFPDYDFVYLVNGVLVITFWGFIHPTGEQRNPMHWLELSTVPTTPTQLSAVPPVAQPQIPLAQPTTPITTHIVETRRRRWWSWRWLLWLLLGLLLMTLLLGLLRGCVPSLPLPHIPGFSGVTSPALTSDHATNQIVGENNRSTITAPTSQNLTLPAFKSTDNSMTESSGVEQITPPPALDATLPTSSASNATTDTQVDNPPANENKKPVQSTEPVVPISQHDKAAQTTPAAMAPRTNPPSIPAQQGKPLTLPPTLPDGPAQFLNGQWRVNGGIQDKLTGRPLQLQYNFQQGDGTVSVRQSNGVTCQGPARGNVEKGALSITNPDKMTCSDGSNFIVPNIECKSPDSGHADCVGSKDGEKTFPIRMLQPNT